MRKAAQKILPPVFWLGVFIAFSSLLWLAIHSNTDRANALSIGSAVFLCAVVQVAAYLGGRVFKKVRFWPAGCMLVSAPATLWCAYVGPATLYGDSVNLLDFTGLDAKPPFYYFALPVMIAGLLACVAWAVVGLLFLAADITDMTAERRDAAVKARYKTLLEAPEGSVVPTAEDTATAAEDAATAPLATNDAPQDDSTDDSAGVPTAENTPGGDDDTAPLADTANGPTDISAEDAPTNSDENEGEKANDSEEG